MNFWNAGPSLDDKPRAHIFPWLFSLGLLSTLVLLPHPAHPHYPNPMRESY